MNMAINLQVQFIMEHENLPLTIFSDVKDLHAKRKKYAQERGQTRKDEK